MRLIDADALKAHYAWWGDYPEEAPERAEEKKIFDTIVDIQPTVDAAPIRRGKWIKNDGRYGWHCSVCGEDDIYAFCYNDGVLDSQDFFCPNCGARMEG